MQNNNGRHKIEFISENEKEKKTSNGSLFRLIPKLITAIMESNCSTKSEYEKNGNSEQYCLMI